MGRPQDCFTDRDDSVPFQIAIELELPTEVNDGLRERLLKEAPHLERAIEQIKHHSNLVFVLEGASASSRSYLFVQYIGVGDIKADGASFLPDGVKLLSLTSRAALELYRNVTSADSLRNDIKALQELRGGSGYPIKFLFEQLKSGGVRGLSMLPTARSMGRELREQLELRAGVATSVDEFNETLGQLVVETQEKAEASEKREIEGEISAFAGATRTQPAYARWLMQQFGSTPLLHIRERKQPIGREEAETLLRLKVKRKGPDRLYAIQQTVRALLGVTVDAFEAESRGESSAEMDVDDFLVEANGAGIREALRLILDLELNPPKLVLIEEPEVHLHPGMARVVADYLRRKSKDIQVFLTTHSTDFVDSVSFQSVFLISRDPQNRTLCQTVRAEEAPTKISAELGLRYSTVFMYDRLAFVEGPSDEAVLRELAMKANVDFAKANLGFVHMMGVRNFAHFASEGTMELLTRRQIRMWFVTDRDENEDADVNKMMDRLGPRATLRVLERRELENYLLVPRPFKLFVEEKLRLAGNPKVELDLNHVEAAIQKEVEALKEEVVRLRSERKLLIPVYLQTRKDSGPITERLERAIKELGERAKSVEGVTQAIRQEVGEDWLQHAWEIVPGSTVLMKATAALGATYSPEKGDAERLARHVYSAELPFDLRSLLQDLATG
jgi:hypothetical protein